MQDILTACRQPDEPVVKAFLIGVGQTYVATYGPFKEDVITFDGWVAPTTNFIGVYHQDGPKVLVHTTI